MSFYALRGCNAATLISFQRRMDKNRFFIARACSYPSGLGIEANADGNDQIPKRTYCEQRTNSVHFVPSVDSGGAAGAALSGGRIPAIRSSTMSQPALRLVEGSSMDKSKALSTGLSTY